MAPALGLTTTETTHAQAAPDGLACAARNVDVR